MITVDFKTENNIIVEFTINGHANGKYGTDIVCASVSSAAYMAVNTLTEVMRIDCQAEDRDGYMHLKISKENAKKAKDVLDGFRLHITELALQYPNEIKVITRRKIKCLR